MTTNILNIEILDQFDKDTQYIESNRWEWLNQFSDCWVVVYGETLICHAESFHEALTMARAKGVRDNRMAIERISSAPRSMIL